MATQKPSHDEIHTKLDELDDALADVNSHEEGVAARVEELRDEIRASLEQDDFEQGDANDNGELLSGKLEEVLQDLEEDYPEITLRIQDAIRTLVNAGL